MTLKLLARFSRIDVDERRDECHDVKFAELGHGTNQLVVSAVTHTPTGHAGSEVIMSSVKFLLNDRCSASPTPSILGKRQNFRR
jgi:hypothetical protein